MSDEEYMRWGAEANRRFELLHLRARVADALSALTGRPTQLRPFDEVAGGVEMSLARDLGVREIPLDRIVGSVGKPDALTPGSFLPRKWHLKERWKRVYAASQGALGLPPIAVFQVGDDYYIRDGHHRVSVARYLGARTILADVTDVPAGAGRGRGDRGTRGQGEEVLRA